MNYHTDCRHPNKHRHKQAGVSLIELMVAMTIGLFLIAGATKIYIGSRASYATNDSIARLQETGRYAMSVIETDVGMTNYWGLTWKGVPIVNQAGQTDAASTFPTGPKINECGNNFAVDLAQHLQADNKGFFLSPTRDNAKCASFHDKAVATADTITVRRAASSATLSGGLLICSTRTKATLVNTAADPSCDAPPTGLARDLMVDTYYVSQDSLQQNGLPSLRRKVLEKTQEFKDEEVIPGVEDLQIQFGIAANATSPEVTRYVNPGDSALNSTQIVTVRIWLLVRGESPEPGFVDNKPYEYGDRVKDNGTTADLENPADFDKAYLPSGTADDSVTSVKHYRRLLISRTIQLRNATGT
jgi:type IV pilus assembly protein PilW